MNTDFDYGVFFWVLVGMLGLTFVQMYCSYKEGTFSIQQMKELGHTQGFKQFLPFAAHGGALYGDILLVTPLVALIAAKYGDQWSALSLLGPFMIAVITTFFFHWWWAKDALHGCLVYDRELTTTGWMHAVYMSAALTIIILFYFHTRAIDHTFLKVVSIVIGVHVVAGHHMVLSWIKPDWWPYNTHKDWKAWVVTLGCWIGLFIRCRQILKGN